MKEFYNIDRTMKKRDLPGISLHKHPDSNLHGLFSDLRSSSSQKQVKNYQLSY